jgi:hypothetical protein
MDSKALWKLNLWSTPLWETLSESVKADLRWTSPYTGLSFKRIFYNWEQKTACLQLGINFISRIIYSGGLLYLVLLLRVTILTALNKTHIFDPQSPDCLQHHWDLSPICQKQKLFTLLLHFSCLKKNFFGPLLFVLKNQRNFWVIFVYW